MATDYKNRETLSMPHNQGTHSLDDSEDKNFLDNVEIRNFFTDISHRGFSDVPKPSFPEGRPEPLDIAMEPVLRQDVDSYVYSQVNFRNNDPYMRSHFMHPGELYDPRMEPLMEQYPQQHPHPHPQYGPRPGSVGGLAINRPRSNSDMVPSEFKPSAAAYHRFEAAKKRKSLDQIRGDRVKKMAIKDFNVIEEKGCACRKTECLKLYCECFSKAMDCTPACKCYNCKNNTQYEYMRTNAINIITTKNKDAFKTKAGRGCNCRKSQCMKKYCECFQADTPCTDKCKCSDCSNRLLNLFGPQGGYE